MRCLFYRWRISNALDRDAGGTGGEASLPHRHMERCPACRAYHQQCLAMGRALHAAKSCAAEKSDRRVWASGDLGGLTPAVLGWTGVALAAMAIAAVAIYVDYEIESRNGPKPMIVARPAPAVPPEDAAVEVQPDAPAAVADATAAETTTTTTRQTLLTRVGQNVAEFASPASEPLLEELAGTRDQLSAMGQSLLAPFPSYLFTTPPDETSDAQPPT